MLIELERIRRDGGTQQRCYMDSETVERYADVMESGKELPALEVVFDGVDYWLIDGHHRHEAAKRRGVTHLDCVVREGNQSDAQWLSVSANATNALQRSRWDIQQAITTALRHPMGAGLSDHAIAEHVGCTHKTVGAQRKRLKEAGEIAQSDRRTGRDGRTMNTSAINANRGAAATTAPSADDPDDEIQVPEGGWPEMEDGVYPTELAEPVFCNKGHAQAVIHVLQVEPLAWQGVPRWVANAGIVGVSGCELAMPLDQTIARSTREEAIAWAAQDLAVHVLRCLQDESLLASRRATLEYFLDWAGEQGASRITAADQLKKEEQERDRIYVSLAEETLYNVIGLANETGRTAEAYQNWGRIVTEMIAFADAGDVEGCDEMRLLIDQVDVIEARFTAIITAIREYKARQPVA